MWDDEDESDGEQDADSDKECWVEYATAMVDLEEAKRRERQRLGTTMLASANTEALAISAPRWSGHANRQESRTSIDSTDFAHTTQNSEGGRTWGEKTYTLALPSGQEGRNHNKCRCL